MHGTLDLNRSERLAAADRPRRRWLPWLIVLLVAAAAAGWFLLGPGARKASAPSSPAAGAAAPNAPSVTVLVPGRATVAAEVVATGSIAARRTSPVGVQGEGGLVTAVLVTEGDYVRRGQLLVRIDRAVQSQQLVQMAAGIRQAEADARLAQAELERAQSLVSRGFISKADIDRKTATRDSANARVAVARAQMTEMQARVARLDVRAPDDGLILTRSVEPGQVVGAGSSALFTMAQGGLMEMRALVAEQDLQSLRPGQSAEVAIVGNDRRFPGRIWLIDPVIDPNARQGLVRVLLGRDPALRPGAFARATVQTGAAEAPVLPQSAIQSDEKGNFVMLVGADAKVTRRDVTLGRVTAGGIAILDGLSGDERVVESAGAFLNPGETVRPVYKRAAAG